MRSPLALRLLRRSRAEAAAKSVHQGGIGDHAFRQQPGHETAAADDGVFRGEQRASIDQAGRIAIADGLIGRLPFDETSAGLAELAVQGVFAGGGGRDIAKRPEMSPRIGSRRCVAVGFGGLDPRAEVIPLEGRNPESQARLTEIGPRPDEVAQPLPIEEGEQHRPWTRAGSRDPDAPLGDGGPPARGLQVGPAAHKLFDPPGRELEGCPTGAGRA